MSGNEYGVNSKDKRNIGGGDEGDALRSEESPSTSRHAPMPVDRYTRYYNMNHKGRGMALIFNQEYFDSGLDPRHGTNKDCDNLVKVLKQLGFQVTKWNNLKAEEVYKYIKQTADMDHSDYDCLLVAVLSHGELGVLHAKDTHYQTHYLWYHFTADKCPSLAGKPKLFFLQACQGDKLDEGITLRSRIETDCSPSALYYPFQPDFLIVYSTVPGYYSWRNSVQGSWFIQALCEELGYYGDKRDILTLLTIVSQKVALNFESYCPDKSAIHQKKQVPCITSMLTHLLVFKKKDRH